MWNKFQALREASRKLRLDFLAFQIAGPTTDPAQVASLLNGSPIAVPNTPGIPPGIPNSAVGQCETDRFQVTSGSANNPPAICGVNTDEHMFVDADENCNALTFQFGGGALNREFSIKITQYACDSANLAPTGCTQYFATENGRGSVQTFNFAGGLHLADQNQVMCVRQNRDSCRICWTTVANEDFDVSGSVTSGYGDQDLVTSCGAPMSDGLAPEGLDVLIIPSAKTVNNVEQERSRFCGRNSGLAYNSIPFGIQTICSQSAPFRINFRSDSFESLGPAIDSSLPPVPPLVTMKAVPYPVDEVLRKQLESTEILLRRQDQFLLPKSEPDVFDGTDLTKFRPFLQAFRHLIERRTDNDGDRLYYLDQYTRGDARELVRSCIHMDGNLGFERAMELLSDKYGNEYKVAQAFIQKLESWPPVREEDGKGLEKLAIFLTTCENYISDVGALNQLHSPKEIQAIAHKLPKDLQKRWRSRACTTLKQNSRVEFHDLSAFIRSQSEVLNCPIFGELQSSIHQRAGLSSLNEFTVHAVAMETWRAFHSQDGPSGSRNGLGQVLFPSNVATKSTS
eukprot:maker-scaffold938_size78735-snap-gene-0.14 protein:Tk04674 transcript:maker-scaffold938_size78735-snap-gene-0.14-mRNA-1 annotation:"PREDICTED: uncharacterized protein LOC102079537"